MSGGGTVVEEIPGVRATPLPAAERTRLLLWVAVPVLVLNFAAPYLQLIALPLVFFLKNRLHQSPDQVALFALIAASPTYIGFLGGFIRDRWSPFGAGDRGHLVVFGLGAVAAFAALAFAPPTYGLLLAGAILVGILLQFVTGAASGIATAIGRRHAMSGQMSTAMNTAIIIPAVASGWLGGLLAGSIEDVPAARALRSVFLIGAGLMVLIAAFGAFGPKRVFEDGQIEPEAISSGADFVRLLKWWPIYPALLIQLLWQFAPGAGIAMQFHLSNDIHASDGQVGLFYTIFYGGFIPMYGLYAWLAQRISLRPLVWIGGVLAVPQMASLLFIHSPVGALWAAVPMGLLGGIGQAAFTDLTIRSSPKGLEGTMMMLFLTMYWVAQRFGDLWGADLYSHHGGFNAALWATIAVYAAILLVIPFVPKAITAGHDA
ncbi:MFS transporter [Phenylobacterium sp.]|uniref:MFS transporter n=1 Tax=Phenylobacterium sp. TaxID=1871053 RepID=UPI002BA35A9A|nr:MFS transporter [Phenylobacterium sp.]HLZ76024.1 MFS transporter [Phenylobacterium sp.]